MRNCLNMFFSFETCLQKFFWKQLTPPPAEMFLCQDLPPPPGDQIHKKSLVQGFSKFFLLRGYPL